MEGEWGWWVEGGCKGCWFLLACIEGDEHACIGGCMGLMTHL